MAACSWRERVPCWCEAGCAPSARLCSRRLMPRKRANTRLRTRIFEEDKLSRCLRGVLPVLRLIQGENGFVQSPLDQLDRSRIENFASQNIGHVKRVHRRALLRQNFRNCDVELQLGEN